VEPGRERTRFPKPELETVRERKPVEVEDFAGGGTRVISVEIVQSVSVSPDHDVGPGILTRLYICSYLINSCLWSTHFSRKGRGKRGFEAAFKYKETTVDVSQH
jgi:hypothetical protein